MRMRQQVLIPVAVIVVSGLAVLWQLRPDAQSPAILSEVSLRQPEDQNDTSTQLSQAVFADVTSASGVDFRYRNGEQAEYFTILESLGGGIAVLDYDGDGLLDFFATGGGGFGERTDAEISGCAGRLYRNQGDFRFQDVTADCGLDTADMYSHGALCLDADADGWPDLLLTGYTGVQLYWNRQGHFERASEDSGLTDSRWSTSAAAADLWGQGKTDLFVCRYVDWSFLKDPVCPERGKSEGRDVCAPQNFLAVPSSLYRFDGSSFLDHWETIQPVSEGKALGVVIADFNDDGRPDIYVANDASANWLFLNEGQGGFRECALEQGVAVDDNGDYNGSMGVDVGDFDDSGKASIWVTNFESELPALYRNTGSGGFAWQTQASGLGRLGGRNVGFGTAFVDFDNDGRQDLVFVNGHVVRYPRGAEFLQRPVLLRNVEIRGRQNFVNVSSAAGEWFLQPSRGRGLAKADLNNDGWPDLIVSHTEAPVTILRNLATDSVRNHWLGLQLEGQNNRPLAGATVRVQLQDGERQLTQFVKSGGSYLSSSDPRLVFGLGEADQVVGITVRWPWGELQHWDALDVDQYWVLSEGNAEAVPAAGTAIRQF